MLQVRSNKMIVSKKRKGISTFIATLLLMVLAVSAGVVIYAYVMGYLGGFGGPQTMGGMSIDSSSLVSGAPGTMTAYIRNIGHTTLVFDKAYVNGVSTTFTLLPTGSLAEGKVTAVTISTTFVAAQTYEFKLIAQDNTQITFNLKAK